MTQTTAAPVMDHTAAGWHSEIKYRIGGPGPNSTCRNEARAWAWLKKQAARSARRNSRRDLRASW